MHKQEWFGYFAAVGIGPDTVTTGHLIGVVGWFEIALGVAVLFKPARSLLLFVVAWKVGTEFLRYSAGEPMWEFIERGGSYAAPLALLIATTWLRREKALTATAESAGPRTLTDSGFSRQESEIPRVDLFGEPGRILREQTLPRRGPGAHRSRETAIPK